MAVFAIVPIFGNAQLSQNIQTTYANDHLKIGESWLIVDSVGAKEVSEKLGIAANSPIAGIVFPISLYWGAASQEIWVWMQSRLSRMP